MDPSTADGGSGPAAVELTSLATVAAAVDPSTELTLATVVEVDPSTADGGSGRAAVELTSLATVAAAVHRRSS